MTRMEDHWLVEDEVGEICCPDCSSDITGFVITDIEPYDDALQMAIGDLLEAEGKPRTGPGADEARRLYLHHAKRGT